MAIKINGQNLSKRIYNGQEVQRVILNGSQIRPTEEQHIDYHVVSNFSSVMPGGWDGNGVYPIEEGITVAKGVDKGTVDYSYITGMPSLSNAEKIEIVVTYGWDQTIPSPDTDDRVLDVRLRNIIGDTQDVIIGDIAYYNGHWLHEIIQLPDWADSYSFSGVSEGIYTTSILINMEDEYFPFATINTEGPSGFSAPEAGIDIERLDIPQIRSCNDLNVGLKAGVLIKRIDFYVYN